MLSFAPSNHAHPSSCNRIIIKNMVGWSNHWSYCTHWLKESCTFIEPFPRGFNTEIAMRKAKENVEKHYAVVGVLEELNKTLTVLEHYVPRFFKGAKDVYWSECNISDLRQLLSLHLCLLQIQKPQRNISFYCFRNLSLPLSRPHNPNWCPLLQTRCRSSHGSTGTYTSPRWLR